MIRKGWSSGLSPIWEKSFCVGFLPAELIGTGDEDSKRRQVFDDLEQMVTENSAQCDVIVSGHIVTDHEEPEFAAALFLFTEVTPEAEASIERIIKYCEMPADEVDVHCMPLVQPPAAASNEAIEIFKDRKESILRSLTESGRVGCPIIRKGAA